MTNIYDYLTIPEEQRIVSIEKSEMQFIMDLLEPIKAGISKTLEIGLAYGFSACAIMSATNKPHISVDPYQVQGYSSAGINNIKKLGLTPLFQHEADLSHNALPKLLFHGQKFDFIFIDGDHKFDTTFIDYYYSDFLVKPGGFILFHDYTYPAVRKIADWIRTNRKDFTEIPTGCPNLFLIQKTDWDKRDWKDYNEF